MTKNFLAVCALLCASTLFAFAGITVSSPTNGSANPSSVHIVASVISAKTVTSVRVYVDGTLKLNNSNPKVDMYVTLPTGAHTLNVQAWDNGGASYKVVNTFTAGTTLSAGLLTYLNMDQQTGWSSCDTCSGINQAGPATPHSITYNQTSPSLDGNSAQLWLGGSTPYASALWWKGVGASNASHFKYDLYFYLKNSAASQALEFDVYQTINGKHYVLGMECSLKTSHMWSTYDTANHHWIPSSAPCNYISPYVWHHLTTETERTSDGRIHFISVTLDGQTYYINKYAYPVAQSGNNLTVALQLDGNSTMTNYSEWVDKVNLTSW
jgi:Big-like domain-containing protein